MIDKKVSIIVPVYNSEKYLENCIESILLQTYKNLEILLINDGSTDNSENICKKYASKDFRIKYIYKENSGVSNTRNIGIKYSTGDYIVFIDSDDVVHKEIIEILLNEKKVSDSWIICNRMKFNKTIEEEKSDKHCVMEYLEESYIDIYKKRILNPPFAKLYESDIIKSNNIYFDEALSLGEDLIFNIEYLQHVKSVKFVDSKLYYYRIGNEKSLSKKYYHNMLEIQSKLVQVFTNYFSKSVNERIIKEEEKNFYFSVISNELHNKNINIFKRYYNVCKLINNTVIKEKINEYKKLKIISSMEYFFICNGLYIVYLIKSKLKK